MRSAVFAAVCVLVSAALHGFAGGEPVRPGTLLGAMALAWTGAFLLGGRQRGMDVLLGACFATQYGMHHMFSAGPRFHRTNTAPVWACCWCTP